MSRSFVPVLLGSLLVIFSLGASSARADWLIDRSGTLVQVDGLVLGDDETEEVEVEDQEDQSDDSNDDSDDDSDDEAGKRQMEQAREMAKDRLEVETEARIKAQEVRRETIKSKLEIKDGSLRVRQEVENEDGKIVRKTDKDILRSERFRIEQEDGEMVELSALDDDKLEIIRDRMKARTSLPISIGENNELIITRPDGTTKTVTVLPDVAADNLRERGLTVFGEQVELEEQEDGTPVYRFNTQQEKRFLGLFKRSYSQETTISAETGEVVKSTSTELTPFARFLESLSF